MSDDQPESESDGFDFFQDLNGISNMFAEAEDEFIDKKTGEKQGMVEQKKQDEK